MRRASFFWPILWLLGNEGFAQEPKVKDYQVELRTEPVEVSENLPSRFVVVIRPKAPWGLKATTPFEALLNSSAGVILEKTKLTSKEFADPQSADKSLTTAMSVKAVGPQQIAVALNFFLCTEQVCQRYKENIEYKFNAKPATKPAP